MDTLAARLEHAMKAKDLNAPELAKRAGVTKQSVYNVTGGTTKADTLRASTLFDMARVLEVDPYWLLLGKTLVRPESQTGRIDPDNLHAALTLLLTDENPIAGGGPYRPREQARRLAELYEWVTRDGGRLTAESNARFLEQVEERKRAKGTKPDDRDEAGDRAQSGEQRRRSAAT